MPSYDFRCTDCGEEFTAFVPISKKDDVRCAGCGGEHVRQLVTAFYHSSSARSGGSGNSACTRSTCGGCAACGTRR